MNFLNSVLGQDSPRPHPVSRINIITFHQHLLSAETALADAYYNATMSLRSNLDREIKAKSGNSAAPETAGSGASVAAIRPSQAALEKMHAAGFTKEWLIKNNLWVEAGGMIALQTVAQKYLAELASQIKTPREKLLAIETIVKNNSVLGPLYKKEWDEQRIREASPLLTQNGFPTGHEADAGITDIPPATYDMLKNRGLLSAAIESDIVTDGVKGVAATIMLDALAEQVALSNRAAALPESARRG